MYYDEITSVDIMVFMMFLILALWGYICHRWGMEEGVKKGHKIGFRDGARAERSKNYLTRY